MNSIITQEEFFNDSYHFLKDIRDIQQQILEDLGNKLLNSLDRIGGIAGTEKIEEENAPNTISSLGSNSTAIKDAVDSVNSLDDVKAELLLKVSDSFSSLKIPTNKIPDLNSITESLTDFAGGINDLDIDEEKVESYNMLMAMVGSIGSVSRSLTFNAPFLLIATPTAKLLPILFSALARAADAVDGRIDSIERFPRAMRGLGIGLTIFSLGLAGSIAIMGYSVLSKPENLLTLGLVLGAVSTAALVIGMRDREIRRGAVTMGIIGLSLPIMAGGIAISAQLMKGVGAEGLLLMGGVLTATSLMYFFIGKNMGSILKGAVAVGAIGLSLWLLSSPLENLGNMLKDKDVLWTLPVLLTGLGVVYGLAGLAVAFIVPGALAFGAIGLSLIPLGMGLEKIMSIPKFTKEKAENFTHALVSVIKGLSSVPLTSLVTLPLKLPIIAGIGLALIPLASGIESFMSKTADFSEKDADRMEYVISKTSQAFATAGSTNGMSKLFGFNVGKNDIERGVDATMKIGKNLNYLAEGIKVWRDGKFTNEDMELVANNVTNVMNTIPAVFADIGQRERGSSNQIKFGGFQFGVPFTKTDTELGIATTMRMGENLQNLYTGIIAWRQGGENDISPQLPGIIANITSVITAIPQAFVKVGEMEAETEKFFGLIDGNVEEGVELVARMTRPLKSMADILNAFKDGVNADKVALNLSTLMGGIVTNVDDFTDDRLDRLESIIDLVDDLNDAIVDHFKVMSDIPTDDLAAFGDYAKSLKMLSDTDMNKVLKVMEAKKAYIESPAVTNVTNLRRETTIQESRVNTVTKELQSGDKNYTQQLENINLALKELLFAARPMSQVSDVLELLRNGKIRVEVDDDLI